MISYHINVACILWLTMLRLNYTLTHQNLLLSCIYNCLLLWIYTAYNNANYYNNPANNRYIYSSFVNACLVCNDSTVTWPNITVISIAITLCNFIVAIIWTVGETIVITAIIVIQCDTKYEHDCITEEVVTFLIICKQRFVFLYSTVF